MAAGVPTIGAFLPYKQYVISLFIERPKAEEKDLLDWVRKSFDAQVPLLDKFTPTPEANLTALKVDPNNLLARAVIKSAARAPRSQGVRRLRRHQDHPQCQ